MPAIQEAWQFTWKGERLPVVLEGDILHLAQPLYEWDLVVLA